MQAHGLNAWKDVSNVLALAVVNPTPGQLAWMRERTGMTPRDITQAFRIHSVYQALGRCSIRARDGNHDPKTVLVAGKDDARFLNDLFPGSHWLGQVGALPSLAKLQAAAGKKEMGKVDRLAKAISDHLDGLPESVEVVRTKDLKKLTCTSSKGADELFDRNAWTRVFSQITTPGSGWIRQGQRLVRVNAETYGFQGT